MRRRILGIATAVLVGGACADGTSSTSDGSAGDARPDSRADARLVDAPAGPEDGGPVPTALDGAATPNQVSCGAQPCDTTMQQHCCSSGMMPTCTTTCSGMIDLGCDGPEDCASGQACCGSPSMMGFRTACAQSCTASQVQLCHNASQCPSSAPICCGPMGAPMGGCSPAGSCQ